MLLSRFWYVTLSLLLGAAVFVLYLAMSMFNRAGDRTMSEALNSDSQVVAWYLRGDARERSGQLIRFAVDQDLAKNLQKSSDADKKVPDDAQDAVARTLAKINATIPKADAFDAVFVVDQHGRVVAHMGYEQVRAMGDFELGGYPVVADALHGYIRDDTLVLDRIYRVVARPVEYDLGQLPAGAIVGARIVDDRFARELSARTGAVVAFHSKGARVATGAPEGFDVSRLDQMFVDMERLKTDKEYQEKGRSRVRMLSSQVGVQYSRLPGEAWQLGAGYAVGRRRTAVDGPLGFFSQSDDVDKEHANLWLAVAVAAAAALIGLLLSIFEHTRPLRQFRNEAMKLAQGKLDQLQPSRFRGIYRKIASDLNDGIEVIAAKGGVPRRAADLKQVLGDIPEQPMMSAFAFPDESAPSAARPPLDSAPQASRPRRPPPAPGSAGRPAPGPASAPGPGQNPEWVRVFQDFVAMKRECGEDLQGFTYEKFENTLRKNQEAIVARHGAARVRFSVYVKGGKAALKASPIRE